MYTVGTEKRHGGAMNQLGMLNLRRLRALSREYLEAYTCSPQTANCTAILDDIQKECLSIFRKSLGYPHQRRIALAMELREISHMISHLPAPRDEVSALIVTITYEPVGDEGWKSTTKPRKTGVGSATQS